MRTNSSGLQPARRQEVSLLAVLREQYQRVRAETDALCAPLHDEDCGVQGASFVSPPKWHLAHTSWFFERFLLEPALRDYRPFDPHYAYLFNSYYEQMGEFHPRNQRGILSRPTRSEIKQYRSYVDDAMSILFVQCLAEDDPDIVARIELGLHHEQQHQELLLMDVKFNFALNPLRPAYHEAAVSKAEAGAALRWLDYEGGLISIGHIGKTFAFDNETPSHTVFLRPFRLASRLVTNGEYMEFIKSGGYEQPQYWLSDGWQGVREHHWKAPLYWEKIEERWWQMDLSGMCPVDECEPVCHVNFYEADAYARWAGKRLPTEVEWECAARDAPIVGNFMETRRYRPDVARGGAGNLAQMFGDAWEWMCSAYAPYPGYRAPAGAIGEYNGKFMCNQMVLRGGACVTPRSHVRASYRNFYYPSDRWQFAGIRLADDA